MHVLYVYLKCCTFFNSLFSLLQADWKGLQWMYIDTEELKESCDSQLTTLDSMGAYSNNWDIKTTLIEEINEILVHTNCNLLSRQFYVQLHVVVHVGKYMLITQLFTFIFIPTL